MKKSIIAFAAAIGLMPFAARGSDIADMLTVNLRSQESVHFALASYPTLSFSGNVLSISSNSSDGIVDYDLSAIKDITFASSSSFQLPAADVLFEIIDNVVTVKGLPADTDASVTDSAGRRVLTVKSDASGCAVMDLRPLANGVYIISASKITYKYSKRH